MPHLNFLKYGGEGCGNFFVKCAKKRATFNDDLCNKGRCYRFNDLSSRNDKIEVVAKWDLPPQMVTAESLIVIREGIFVVAGDTKEDINSIFLVAEEGKKDIQIGE